MAATSIITARFRPGFTGMVTEVMSRPSIFVFSLSTPHAVVNLVLIPLLEIDHKVDLLGHFDRTDTEYTAGVYDSDTSKLDKMTDVIGRRTDQSLGRYTAYFHSVVGDETVAALYKLNGGFALPTPLSPSMSTPSPYTSTRTP